MYKLGYTSGLAEANCDEGKSTIKCVGDIVDKLAKKCCDVPKKMRAPSKIIEVTNGCFSSAQVVQVCDEFGGNGADGDAEESAESESSEDSAADKACDGAAKTSGCCGGGKSSCSGKQDAKDSSCNKSCCGGKSSSKNQCTGQKLSDMMTPSGLADFVGSMLPAQYEQINMSERQFKHLYCDRQPYPECATCPYNTKNFRSIERDIDLLFRQISDAIDELINGNYDLSTMMFQCPGQLNALLRANLGPIGNVAAAAISGSLIALTAARGALYAYEGIATAARYTDFRREVMYCADRLLQSGALVGLPGVFASTVGSILTAIGCTAGSMTRLTSRSGSARSSRFGGNTCLWGSRSTGRKCETIPYKSAARPTASVESKEKADKTLKKVEKVIAAAKTIDEQARPATPTSRTKTYTPTKDVTAQPDKHYYRIDPVTDKKKEVIFVAGEPLEPITAQVGEIFEVEDNGVTLPDPTTPSTDTVVTEGKIYVVQDPITEEFVDVSKVIGPEEVEQGTTIEDVKEELAEKYDIPAEKIVIYDRQDPAAGETYAPTEDTVANPDHTYYKVNEDGAHEVITIPAGDPIPPETYVKLEIPEGDEDDAVPFNGTGPCVLDDGLIVNTPEFLDAGSMDMAVDTKVLITKTGVLAGDMAKIEGIELSVYEIKMAYVLDHEQNLSPLPIDVEAERIPTILDTVADNS